MNKRGFTLIEIIVSISLIVLLGVGSFFGIRLVNSNIRISKLEQIENKVIEAAQVYIETNKESYNQLYKKNNGVVIPLNVLVNEGLLDLSTTTLEDKDIENEYVITALGGSTPQENCVDIRSTTSWNEKLSEPIYICTDSSGNSNIKLINPSDLSNKNKVEREIFYYKGEYVNNYLTYSKNGVTHNMRILSVDTDDSITVVKEDWDCSGRNCSGATNSFDKIFNNNQLQSQLREYEIKVYIPDIYNICKVRSEYNGSNYKGATFGGYFITQELYSRTVECKTRYDSSDNEHQLFDSSWLEEYQDYRTMERLRYLHLKPCMKITSGTGAEDNPFVLENKC